jgi:hypothetical protein
MSFHFCNIPPFIYLDSCLIYKQNTIRRKEIAGKMLQTLGKEDKTRVGMVTSLMFLSNNQFGPWQWAVL